LTLLTISVILQIEQRKGNRKEQRGKEAKRQRSKMPKVPEGFQTSPVPEDNK